MLIQKVFHVRQSLEATLARLADFRSYRRALEGVDVESWVSGDAAWLEFTTGNGFRAQLEFEALPSEEPNQVLFRTRRGNMQVVGLLECVAIRSDLTEVQLTLEYTIHSPMHSILDAVTASFDRFLNRQLRRLQTCLAGESEDDMMTPWQPRHHALQFAH